MRPQWPESRHKMKFAGSNGDAMQAKKNKLGQRISIQSLKGAHFEVELQEKL